MKLTDEQYEALARYEEHFNKAMNADYVSYPGYAALELMHGILSQFSNALPRLNAGCQHCVLQLVKETARVWYADRDERNAKKVEEPAKKASKKK